MANHNRLRDGGPACVGSSKTLRTDKRFERVIRSLMKSGHSSFAEVVYDAVYARANRLNPSLALPVITEWNTNRELQLEMIDDLDESLGNLGGIITNNPLPTTEK